MNILILGAGQVGSSAAYHLSREEANEVTVIDTQADILRELQDRLDIRTVVGHAAHPDVLARTVGFVQTKQGPMIISARPILRSDDAGPVEGALVMGQFLNEARLARLRERTEVDMSWVATDSSAESSKH